MTQFDSSCLIMLYFSLLFLADTSECLIIRLWNGNGGKGVVMA